MNRVTSKKGIYYVGLLTVVLVWGLDPIVIAYFYRYFSPTVLTTICSLLPALFFTLFAGKQLRRLSADYFKIAVPIGLLNSVACLLQKIGLNYTTPATYAFLEHLSCVMVPLTLLLVFRKKPKTVEWLTAGLCFLGCFILCGVGSEGFSFGVGEILCGTAGLLLGLCIVLTGTYVGKLDVSLYMMIYMWVYFLTSLALSFVLDRITLNGSPLEELTVTLEPLPLIALLLFGFLDVGLCWLLRTTATVHLSPHVVSIFSPFAAVITGVASVLLGMDRLSFSLLAGGSIILAALLLSAIGSFREQDNSSPPS